MSGGYLLTERAMQEYLENSEYIDWQAPSVFSMAKELALGKTLDEDIARACFEFVRDSINHSWDFQQNPVTCKASDVLYHRTGYCYAKSHLLAALLRANNIPAGLCYQRLTITDRPPYCLHGLNAVFLKQNGWYRIDARGNKPGVQAEFCPPIEKLAFPIIDPGESDLPTVYAQPLPVVIEAMLMATDVEQLYRNLPDMRC